MTYKLTQKASRQMMTSLLEIKEVVSRQVSKAEENLDMAQTSVTAWRKAAAGVGTAIELLEVFPVTEQEQIE